jgi:hypothetical protein
MGSPPDKRETTMLTNDFLAGVEVRHRRDELAGYGKRQRFIKRLARG